MNSTEATCHRLPRHQILSLVKLSQPDNKKPVVITHPPPPKKKRKKEKKKKDLFQKSNLLKAILSELKSFVYICPMR